MLEWGVLMARPLLVGVETAPRNFDVEQPSAFGDSVGSDLSSSFYDQLTAPRPVIGPDGIRRVDWSALSPVLAEAWWYADDGRTCTFRLRRGVVSAHGHELTAEDVRWSWERSYAVRDIGKWVGRISSVQEPADVEVVDRYTVAFHLRAPNPALPRTMTQSTPSVYDATYVRPHLTDSDPWGHEFLATHPSGFGPYRLVSLDGESVEIAANPHYWRGRPAIEQVQLSRFPSPDSAVDALLEGDVDFVPGIRTSRLGEVRGDARLRVVPAEAGGLLVQIDPQAEPFNDPLVRQAVACALPYREIIATAFLGQVRRWKSILKPDDPGYDESTWPYEEDLGRARTLLERSSASRGFGTRMVVLPGDGFDIAARIIRDGLSRIGVKIELEFEQATADRGGRTRVQGNLAPLMLRGSTDPGRVQRVSEPLYTFYHDFGPGRMRLFPLRYENEEFYAALREIPTAGHGAAWISAVNRAQQILNADAVAIPVCGQRFFVGLRSELEGYAWYPDNRMPFAELRWRS